jgi:hypothetical protein
MPHTTRSSRECEYGVADEIERRDDRDSRRDADLLDPQSDEDGPKEIRKLRRGEQHCERHTRREALSGKAESKMSSKHRHGAHFIGEKSKGSRKTDSTFAVSRP